jgi:type IV secretion system protein VirD4
MSISQNASQPVVQLFQNLFGQLKSEVGFMLLVCAGFLVFMSLFENQKKGKLAQGRFGGRIEKWSAVRLAYRQLRERKHNQVTLWAGTPKELKTDVPQLKRVWAELKTLILNSPPTLYLSQTQQGTIVCGAPNSGKTYSIIDPCIRAAIAQSLPCVIYDYKGDQMKAHVAYAASQGYEIAVFAPGYAYSNVINPLDFLNDEGDSLMARQLAITINRNAQRLAGGKEDPFFAEAGEKVVEGCFLLAKATAYPDLVMAHAILGLSRLEARLQYAKEQGRLDDFVEASFQQLLQSAESEKTVAGILATAERAIGSFVRRDLLPSFLGKSSISLDIQGKQMLFLQMDLQKQDVVAPLIAAVLHLLIMHNFSQSRQKPLLVSLDEVRTVYLPDLPKWVNAFRSFGFVPLIGYQNFAQIQEIYGRDASKALFAACGTKIFFNPRDEETARMISHYLGEEEILLKTRSRSYGRNGGVSQSEQYHKRPLLTVEQLLKFDQGECVVISPGYKGHGEASVPLRTKIVLPRKDAAIQHRSEELWTTVQQRLEQRTVDRIQDHQALREALQVRRALAERLFPLPSSRQDDFDSEFSPEPEHNSQNVDVPPPVNLAPPVHTDELKGFV